MTTTLSTRTAGTTTGRTSAWHTRLREMTVWNLRERARTTAVVSMGLFLVPLMVFALYPAISESLGTLDVPEGVASLLGGADFSTLPGWINAELVGILGPGALLAFGAVLGAGYLAGQEESGVAGVVLSTPASRRGVASAAAVASLLLVTVAATGQYLGFVVGDLLIRESLPTGNVLATNVHLLSVGLFGAALALAAGALTGRRTAALVVVGVVGLAGFLIQGFASSVSGLGWLDTLSVFAWSTGEQPLINGLDAVGLAVLLTATVVLAVVAVFGWERRDLKA